MRAGVLIVAIACVACSTFAHASERPGDAARASELRDRSEAANAVEVDLLALIERAPDEDRFRIYRTYHQLRGAWVQVEWSRALLHACMQSVGAEEHSVRATLRDQALFALWDLDDARAQIKHDLPNAAAGEHANLSEAIRMLIEQAREIEDRVLADQCAYLGCIDSAGP